jgi:uncharacterized membrane protein
MIRNGYEFMRRFILFPVFLSMSNFLLTGALSSTKLKRISKAHNVDYLRSSRRRFPHLFLAAETEDKNISGNDLAAHEVPIWDPRIRKVMGGIAALGTIETLYLTFMEVTKRAATDLPFCSVFSDTGESSCSSVISGPYSHFPGTEVPLTAVGFVAYFAAFVLAIQPLITPFLARNNGENGIIDDSQNRVLLLTLTSAMATFSVFLMSILFNVLHQTCLYCVASALCSIGLASLAWFGGALPDGYRKEGVSMSFGGGALSLILAVALIGMNDPIVNVNASEDSVLSSSTLLAKRDVEAAELSLIPNGQLPPEVTTESSESALRLAADLEKLDATFYGAYWCSHCYDQKQAFGKQAMQRIPYIECSKEGMNAQVSLCKEKNIPGYPTWEISGKLYPGEKALDEIQEIVVTLKDAAEK